MKEKERKKKIIHPWVYFGQICSIGRLAIVFKQIQFFKFYKFLLYINNDVEAKGEGLDS